MTVETTDSTSICVDNGMFELKILSNAKLHIGREMQTTFPCALVTQSSYKMA